LLDLSTRNRLLAIPVRSRTARLIPILDERGSEIFRLLIDDRKTLSFLPGTARPSPPTPTPTQSQPPPLAASTHPVPASPAGIPPTLPIPPDPLPAEEESALPPADDTIDPATGIPKRHSDARLQTSLPPEILQRRLLDLSRDALTTIEETGVNVLYLALGQLKWFEPGLPESPLHAPIVLVPVQLSRRSASDRFQLRAREEDVEENLSLRTKLQTDFGVTLPPFPDDESFEFATYLGAVAQAVAAQPGWEVLPDAAVLGCFSFAKLLLYRDLSPEAWPAHQPLLERPFLPALLATGFPPPPAPIPETAHLDDVISVERLDHIVDADASQTLAIELVRQGRNIVLHGPPGTGKSQSITNIIATAVLDGKKVLFVAEKLAALEVVQRRLVREGLGDLCLELHSNKASKRAVLEEIGRTWRLGKPRDTEFDTTIGELETRRAALNTHCLSLHQPHPATGLTPYRVLGELIRLGNAAPSATTLDLVGAETWSATDRSSREALVTELGDRIQQMGPPSQHPWRGVRRDALLPTDLHSIVDLLNRATSGLTACRSSAHAMAQALRVEAPRHLADTRQLRLAGRHAVAAPAFDRATLPAEAWDTRRPDLRDLVAAGRSFQNAVAAVGSQVTDSAWEKDFDSARSAIAAHGRSLFRFLQGDYRKAVADLRGVARSELADSFEARLALTDHLVNGQRALRTLRDGDALGGLAFGSAWRREKSDWAQLQATLDWVEAQQADGLGVAFRRTVAALPHPASLEPLATALSRDFETFAPTLHAYVTDLNLDLTEAYQTDDTEQIPFAELETRLAACLLDPRSIFAWSHFVAQKRKADLLQLGPLAEGLHRGTIPAADARNAFRRACFTRVLREHTRLNPDLTRFDGTSHNRLVDEFRKLDRERLAVARFRVLATHHAGLPSMNAGVGAVGIVTAELERKRGHRPVRQLLRDTGSVIQAIKPVFMMSPLSVAQFLAPGAVEFDLLVIDEASQIQPVDALGAIARSRQIVVVGDSRQLPPTRFFARVTGDDEPENQTESSAAAGMQDVESILGLCSARGIPATMLRWHYRSRHHSLIAVSNREFYDDRLFIVPSPKPTDETLGLQFRIVSDGVFDSGGSGSNRIEAKAVCRAVMEHARRHPELSLGVAAFSVRQQQAILDELELLRRENPDTEPFFNGRPDEPFFVKNLENVQGDERDIVFISIGYGRDPDGFLRMNFGPLGAEGGERRLNVLISRARRRCVVFSSIHADDIDLTRASGRGVQALKAFLQFAESGTLGTTQSAETSSPSPFEQTLQEALASQGHQVQARFGLAGFFIDLAIADPQQPGRFLLGIESDGFSYLTSRSARDRDRLRHAVLQDHGWSLHRVWITDWFQNPDGQLKAVIAAIERAKTAAAAAPASTLPPVAPAEDIVREEPQESSATPTAAIAEPYTVASFAPPAKSDPLTLPPQQMTDLLFQIVEIEGPIHEDELVVRVRDLWELPRAGARLQDAVARGVRSLLVARRCIREDGCLDVPLRPVRVRSRDGVSSANLRKPDLLPPSEIRAAILQLIEAAHGVGRRELPTAVARLLGFKSTPPAFRALVEAQVSRLESDKQVQVQGNLLVQGA
jgi:very-short-patch-repair endonuclease